MAASSSGGQLGAPGVDVLVELLDRGDADDRAGHAPVAVAEGQRHLRRGQAVLASQRVVAPCRGQRLGAAVALLAHAGEERHAPGLCRVVEAGGVVLAAEQAEGQRRIGQQRHLAALHQLVQAVVHRAVDQAVGVLHAGDARQAGGIGQAHELGHAPRRLVADADMAHLARLHQPLQAAQLLVDRRDGAVTLRVEVQVAEHRHVARRPVQLVQVDDVGLQPLQAAFAGSDDVVGSDVGAAVAQPFIAAHRPGRLGGQHDARAHPGALAQPVADETFGVAVTRRAGRHRVHLGGVDEVQAALQRVVEQAVRRGFINLSLAEGHGAEADAADLQAAAAEGDGVHGGIARAQ